MTGTRPRQMQHVSIVLAGLKWRRCTRIAAWSFGTCRRWNNACAILFPVTSSSLLSVTGPKGHPDRPFHELPRRCRLRSARTARPAWTHSFGAADLQMVPRDVAAARYFLHCTIGSNSLKCLFSGLPEGSFVTCSDDNTVRIWQSASGESAKGSHLAGCDRSDTAVSAGDSKFSDELVHGIQVAKPPAAAVSPFLFQSGC
jgi:hypothetical protein